MDSETTACVPNSGAAEKKKETEKKPTGDQRMGSKKQNKINLVQLD